MNTPDQTTHDTDHGQQAPALDAQADSLLDALLAHTLAPLSEEGLARAEREGPVRKTRQDLEWDALLERLAAHAVSPEGVELAQRLRPLPDAEAVRRRYREVDQMMDLAQEDEAPPLRGVSDVRRAVAHVQRGGALVAEDLASIARTCDVASRTARYFRHRAERAPHLAQAAARIDPSRELRDTLHHAVEPDGTLSDKASPDLLRLRRAVQNQHDRIRAKVEGLLRADELQAHLQEDYFTLREDRYVLPVRSSAQNVVGGIVHGYSSSGQTAFVEPQALVELNNQLRWAQMELREEEQRILRRLSELVAHHSQALVNNGRVLAYLDLIYAQALLGRELRGAIPTISDDDRPQLELKGLRHPLLYLKNTKGPEGRARTVTVANDVLLEPGKRSLIISGPNTGGKTVLLKAVGLCALMARCGVPLPVDEDSSLPLFDPVFTDIGDEQSIERDLSTFSGHLVNIEGFLPRCGPGTLVLLDELFIGTDPLQGAALAVALLEELAARGATTVVTTHLESLKTLALENERYANASMGFDLTNLSPTYRLTLGLPGSSYALRIAERLGFPQPIVDRALAILEGEAHQSVDEVVGQLEEQLEEMRRERQRLERARREAETARDSFREREQKLRTQEKGLIHEESRKLKAELDEARDRIRNEIASLQRAASPESRTRLSQRQLEQMRQHFEEQAGRVAQIGERSQPARAGAGGMLHVPLGELEEGLEIWAQPFNRRGVIVDIDEAGGEATVQFGALKSKVNLHNLYYPTDAARRAHLKGGAAQRGAGNTRGNGSNIGSTTLDADEASVVVRTDTNTLDLRGLRVDDALERVDMFLDQACLQNIPVVMLIHGHGTGALKRAVRGHLTGSRYVRDFRRGERNEGGDGVTVAVLQDPR